VNFDATTDPALHSWVPVAPGSDFPIQNLPYGAFVRAGHAPRLGIAIGASVLDLHALASAGTFDDLFPGAGEVLAAESLNPLLGCGRSAWRLVRERVSSLLGSADRRLHDAGLAERALVPRDEVTLVLPVAPGDYVDFFSSLQHATNAGRILRPGAVDPLPPNWRYLPIGYHGRTATIVAAGTPIVRPRGQRERPGGPPTFGPSEALDFELELAFVTGAGPEPPDGIAAPRARERIFGVALMNDWSARDIQAWETVPLGPFLGKSFATSLGPWIVTLDALEPYRVDGPPQDPPALPHLATSEAESYDIGFTVSLRSAGMRARCEAPTVISRSNFGPMYWSMAQQLAHATSNGARVRAGDLFGSGTISNDAPDSFGSMLELTWRGSRPLTLGDGSPRAFLDDGDELVMHGASAREGAARVGFGELRGEIVPALGA
jgi:fumarylacetoacetase